MQAAPKDPAAEPLLLSNPPDSDAPKAGRADDLETDEQAANSLSGLSTASDDLTMDSSSRHPREKEELPSSSRSSIGRHSIRRPEQRHAREDDLEIIRDNLSMRHLIPLVNPLVYLLGGLALAIGHHFFNSWANGRPIGPPTKIPQVWIVRAGTAFAFALKTTLSASLTFVICQLLWFSTRRKYLTVQDIDALYQVERRDILSTCMSNAVMHGPLLVGATFLSFLLPITAVFTPASLGVKTATYVEDAPCTVPPGNFSDGWLYPTFFQRKICEEPSDLLPSMERISEITFISGTPTPLPEFCGKNCTYRVAVDSMAFKCEENVQLPLGQMGTEDPTAHYGTWTFWNATSAGDQIRIDAPIYVGWASRTLSGSDVWWINETYGSAYCIPVSARYDFTVQTLNGVQTVSYDVTTGDQLSISAMTENGKCMPPIGRPYRESQFASVAFAARRLLLGSFSWTCTGNMGTTWISNTNARLAPFLNITRQGLRNAIVTWGDVVKGIEETPANITAALLHMADLELVSQSSTCSYIHSDIVYDYSPKNLWGPYGVAILIVTLSLIFGAFVLVRYNPDNLTTSFVDTVSITRNLEMGSFARKPDEQDESKSPPSLPTFRLEMSGGYLGYTTEGPKELKI